MDSTVKKISGDDNLYDVIIKLVFDNYYTTSSTQYIVCDPKYFSPKEVFRRIGKPFGDDIYSITSNDSLSFADRRGISATITMLRFIFYDVGSLDYDAFRGHMFANPIVIQHKHADITNFHPGNFNISSTGYSQVFSKTIVGDTYYQITTDSFFMHDKLGQLYTYLDYEDKIDAIENAYKKQENIKSLIKKI